jgi:hypothetical protein
MGFPCSAGVLPASEREHSDNAGALEREPATISSMTHTARGTFAQYAYPYPWSVNYRYPDGIDYGPRQRHSLR